MQSTRPDKGPAEGVACAAAQVFSSRIGSVRKALKSRVEFVFVDAPQLADPEPSEAGGTSERPVGRTWWTWKARAITWTACALSPPPIS